MNNGWRNTAVEKTCECGQTFVGKYNSRTCPSCKELNRRRAFQRFKDNNPGYWAEWQRKSGAGRRYQLSLYGLDEDKYQRLASGQNQRCAICGKTAGAWISNGGKLVVDHDHSTGRVRGLLCPYCNRALGQFFDNPEVLMRAREYLRDGPDEINSLEDQ